MKRSERTDQTSFLDNRTRLARTLSSPGIGLGALPAHRQAAAMAETPVAAQIHQPLDVDGHLAPQITFDGQPADFLTDLFEVAIAQVFDFAIKWHAAVRTNLLRCGAADAIDRSQTDIGVLVGRNVDTSYACPGRPLIRFFLCSKCGNQPWRCL